MPFQNPLSWSPNPQCKGIWRWGLWQGLGLHEVVRVGPHDGIRALIKPATRRLLLSPPGEGGQSEKAPSAGQGEATRARDRLAPDLGAPACRTLRNLRG